MKASVDSPVGISTCSSSEMRHAAEVHRGRAFVAAASDREKVSRRGVFSPPLPLSLVEGFHGQGRSANLGTQE